MSQLAQRIALEEGIPCDNLLVTCVEATCMTEEEWLRDREGCKQRLRGAAEELDPQDYGWDDSCDHEWVEGVDEDGNLEEPAYDVCVQCGERRD